MRLLRGFVAIAKWPATGLYDLLFSRGRACYKCLYWCIPRGAPPMTGKCCIIRKTTKAYDWCKRCVMN